MGGKHIFLGKSLINTAVQHHLLYVFVCVWGGGGGGGGKSGGWDLGELHTNTSKLTAGHYRPIPLPNRN